MMRDLCFLKIYLLCLEFVEGEILSDSQPGWRGLGKSIAVYTCNSDAEIGKALNMGADILISDVPQKALQLRGHNK